MPKTKCTKCGCEIKAGDWARMFNDVFTDRKKYHLCIECYFDLCAVMKDWLTKDEKNGDRNR